MSIKTFSCGFDLPFELSVNSASDCLLVFLPSARYADILHIYPYYPRIKWLEFYNKISNVLYLADPFQECDYCKSAGGSWFFDSAGYFQLPAIGEWIKNIAIQHSIKKIIFYGSSMGGYAALVLGCLVQDSIAFAECPQCYLEKYYSSAEVLQRLGIESRAPEFSIESFLRKTPVANLNILISAKDHHLKEHVLPLLDYSVTFNSKNTRVLFHIYLNPNYSNGHVALSFDDAKLLIMSELNPRLRQPLDTYQPTT